MLPVNREIKARNERMAERERKIEDLEKRNLEHTMSIPMGKSFVTRGIALATSNGGAPINHSVVLTLL